jgi:triacylglycerol lipase
VKIPSFLFFLIFFDSVRLLALHPKKREDQRPVLLVHGVFSDEAIFTPLQEMLQEHGFVRQGVVPHDCFFGQCSVKNMAEQIYQVALELQEKHQISQIDVVAFSMGALATRYMIQRLGGKEFVRKFISISGPHNGTYTAYLPQFLKGIYDMRPGSDLIEDLKKDINPFGNVEVYSFYTPYDLIVFPNSSAILKESTEVKSFQVALHHQMLKHVDVLAEVVRVLDAVEKVHVAK